MHLPDDGSRARFENVVFLSSVQDDGKWSKYVSV
jgi:hypothetical protein